MTTKRFPIPPPACPLQPCAYLSVGVALGIGKLAEDLGVARLVGGVGVPKLTAEVLKLGVGLGLDLLNRRCGQTQGRKYRETI